MMPEPLYARDHGPPPTCPFIQPTMRKSDTACLPRSIGFRQRLVFPRPGGRTQWFAPASGAAYAPCLKPRQQFFSELFRPEPKRSETQSGQQNKLFNLLQGCLLSPLSGIDRHRAGPAARQPGALI